MITIFSTPKPFIGHAGIIQRNALKSWKMLGPEVEVVLFGDEEGAAEVCAEYGLRQEPPVRRNGFGLKLVSDCFDRAEDIAQNQVLAYVNCDIILLPDFPCAVRTVAAAYDRFLMVGRRWDLEVKEALDFSSSNWRDEIASRALAANSQRDAWFIDYFVFSRGLYKDKIPPLVIGRVHWDNWLLWCAGHLGATVVDASATVRAIHQNHDYGYHPLGKRGVWEDDLARRNLAYAGGYRHLKSIADAPLILVDSGFRRNTARFLKRARFLLNYWIGEVRRVATYRVRLPLWHLLLDLTRPIRSAVGLRSKARGKVR